MSAHPRRIRARSGLIGAAVVLAAPLIGLGAPAAHADANSCSPAPYGVICIQVYGRSIRVDSVEAIRDKADFGGICAYSAAVDVHEGPTNLYHQETGIVRNGECVAGRAYVSFPIGRDFPHGSVICTRFFEGGVQQGGLACATILR